MNPERYARLADLFAGALDEPADRRAALISEIARDDPDLARHLGDLLAIDAARGDDEAFELAGVAEAIGVASDAATGPLASDAASASPASGAVTAPLASGAVTETPAIEGITIRGVIGAGASATVYAAHQTSPPRPVAVKVLRYRDRGALRRFANEAAVLARLDHPGIARVVAFGESGGRPYLVLEHVDGERIDTYARRASLDTRARVRLLIEVCEAVHHAHVRGVIHRDLKPANVLVRADGRVAVVDFGIARTDDASPIATRPGQLIGTPAYMSPEQAQLRPHEVDARSDVYALGVLGYELLVGQLPYSVDELSITQIARVVIEVPPRRAGEVVPSLRGDLEAILDRALAKAPADRYPSAAAFADDLRRYLDRRSVTARTPRLHERVIRFAQRKPALAATLAALATVVVVGGAVIAMLWLEARRARDDAAVRANRQALLAARLTVAVDPTLALARLRVVGSAGVSAEEVGVVADDALGAGVATDVLVGVHGDVRWTEPFKGGRRIATIGYEGFAAMWDRDRRVARILDGGGRARAMRPSPDGELVLLVGDDGYAVFVAADGSSRRELTGHRANVRRSAWSRDGAWAITADDAGAVWRWSREGRGNEVGTATDSIDSLAVDAQQGAVVAGDRNGSLWRWSADGAATSIAAHAGPVIAVCARSDTVVSIGEDGDIRRWRLEEGGMREDGRIDVGAARAAAISDDCTRAAVGTVAGSLHRADLRGTPSADVALEHPAPIRSVVISADGDVIASGDDDGLVQVEHARRGQRMRLRGHVQRVRHLALSLDGQTLVSGSGDEVRIWDLARLGASSLHLAGPIAALLGHPDGASVLVADARGWITRWLPGGSVEELAADAAPPLLRLLASGDADNGVALTADGHTTLRGHEDGTIRASSTGGGPERVIGRLGDDVRYLACSPTLCAGAGDDGVVLAGPPTATEMHEVTRHATRVVALGVAGDVARVCTASADGQLRCVGLDGNVAVRDLHTRAPIAVMLAGGRVDVVGADGLLERVSDLGAPAVTLPIPTGATGAVALPGGVIAIGFADGSVRRYGAPGRSMTELRAELARASDVRLDDGHFVAWRTER